jgi:Flp pilus assembly pilin Flp
MRVRRDENGSALVEFALLMPVLVLILVGMVNYTAETVYSIQVQEGANAGAEYGAIPGYESSLSAIQTYTVALMPYLSGATATANNIWSCTAGGASVPSTTICSGGGTPYKYVVVTTQATVHRLLSYPGFPSTVTLNGYASIQVPWSN